MGSLFQKGQNLSLPVPVQHVLTAGAGKLQAAAGFPRFQQQMYLRIMPQRLIMPDTNHRFPNGFLIYNLSVGKFHIQAKALQYQPFQNFNLDFPHNLHMDFRHARTPVRGKSASVHRPLPHYMKLGLLFFQLAQLSQHFDGIAALRQHYPVCQHRHQNRPGIAALHSQPLPRKAAAQSRHGADSACLHFLCGTVPRSCVHPDLVYFFLPGFLPRPGAAGIAHPHFYPQRSPCHLQVGQSAAGSVPGYLVHSGPEFLRVFRAPGKSADSSQQFLHAVQIKGRTKITGENMPLRNCPCQHVVLQYSLFQKLLQQSFITHGQFFPVCFPSSFCLRSKLLAPAIQLRLQSGKESFPVRPGLVHLVYKKKHGDAVLLQELPECLHMPLHAIRTADNQKGIIQNLKRTFHLRAEIHMSRGVQQSDLQPLPGDLRLFGENRNAPFPFHGKVIQKCILVIHSAQLPNPAAGIQHSFCQGGFSRVHMCQNPHH